MAVDAKYGQVEIPGIPEDEPVFIIRAKDVAALDAIMDYFIDAKAQGAEFTPEHENEALQPFLEWRNSHKELVKVPD